MTMNPAAALGGALALVALPAAADEGRWVGQGSMIVFSAPDEESEPVVAIACRNGSLVLDMPDVALHAGSASSGELVMSIRTAGGTREFIVPAEVEFSDYLGGYTPRLVFKSSAEWFGAFLGGDMMDVNADGRPLLRGLSLQGTRRLASTHLGPCL